MSHQKPLLDEDAGPHEGVKLSICKKIAFTAPMAAFGALGVTLGTSLLSVYTVDHAVPTSYIAIVQFVAGLLASYLQLILGYLGDRTTLKFGRRRPYLLFGMPATCVSAALLYILPGNNVTTLKLWFTLWYTIFVVFREFVMVPYNALATELTQDDTERKSLYSFLALFNILGVVAGSVLGSVLPYMVAVPVFAGAAGVGILGVVFTTTENPAFIASAKDALPLIPGIRSCLQNKQWLILMLSGTSISLINEIVAVFQYLLRYVFMVDPKTHMIMLLLPYILTQLVCIPAVFAMANRWGKVLTWKVGAILIVCYGIIAFFMSGVNMYAFMASIVLFGAGLVCANVTFSIFTSDTIDYDELLTGKRRESTYHSVGNLPSLFFSTAGKALPLVVLSITGFKAGAATQPEAALVAIRAMVTLFPGAVLVIAAIIFSAYALTEKRHDSIMAGIKAFKDGRVPLDPFSGKPVVRETLLAAEATDTARGQPGFHARQVDISTYLLYFTPNDVRMLASRWRTRVITKFAGATLFWLVDTVISIAASVVLLRKGHQQIAFIGLTCATLFSIGFAYEMSRWGGISWILTQSKNDLVGYARAYMFQHRKSSSSALQMGGMEGGLGASGQAAVYDDGADSIALRTKEAVGSTAQAFSEDMSHATRMMAKAIVRFLVIHSVCFTFAIAVLIGAIHLPDLTLHHA